MDDPIPFPLICILISMQMLSIDEIKRAEIYQAWDDSVKVTLVFINKWCDIQEVYRPIYSPHLILGRMQYFKLLVLIHWSWKKNCMDLNPIFKLKIYFLHTNHSVTLDTEIYEKVVLILEYLVAKNITCFRVGNSSFKEREMIPCSFF